MDVQTLESLLDLGVAIAAEVETDDRTADEVLNEEVAFDPEIQQAVLTLAKRIYRILGWQIDADRMGELINEVGLDPDFFDKYLANP